MPEEKEVYLFYTRHSEDCIFYSKPALIKVYYNLESAKKDSEEFNKKNKPYAYSYIEVSKCI